MGAPSASRCFGLGDSCSNGGGGGGGGDVQSVNGKTGYVVLDAPDVNAVPGIASPAGQSVYVANGNGPDGTILLRGGPVASSAPLRVADGQLRVGTAVLPDAAVPLAQMADQVEQSVSHAGQPGSLGLRPSHLADWWAALAGRHDTPANIVMIGDSLTTLDMFGAPPIGQSVEHVLNGGGLGEDPAGWRCADPAGGVGGLTPRFDTCDGTQNPTVTGALGMDLTSGDEATIVGGMDGISIVYTAQAGGGSIEVRDGVGGTLLDTIDTSTGAHRAGRVWTSGALTLDEHTIHLTATGPVTIDGALVHRRNRDRGVRVWNAGRSGYNTQQFIDEPRLALDIISDISPDLVVLATGTNDQGTANYGTRMRALIDAVQLRHTGPIALWVPHRSANWSDSSVDEARLIATEFDLGVIDAAELMGQPIAQTPWQGLGVHQNWEGGILETSHMAAALSGDPLGVLARLTPALPLIRRPDGGLTLSGSITAPSLRTRATGEDPFLTVSWASENGAASIANLLGPAGLGVWHVVLAEAGAPIPVPASGVAVGVQVNGSGKREAIFQFPTGDPIVVATEA